LPLILIKDGAGISGLECLTGNSISGEYGDELPSLLDRRACRRFVPGDCTMRAIFTQDPRDPKMHVEPSQGLSQQIELVIREGSTISKLMSSNHDSKS